MELEPSGMMSTMQLFPEWNNRLLEDSNFEASQSHVKLLQDEGRIGVWEMCLWFGCEGHGVPGQACRLLERYLYKVLHDFDIDINGREFLQSLQAQVPILMASCITLAAKMNNSASPVVAKVVHIILMCKRILCSVDDLIAHEFKVYSTLDFRVPLWTNVEIGEMLAVEIGYPLKTLNEVATVVDMAEYRRHVINRKVRWAAKVSPSSSSGVLSLHLTAGAVAATVRLAHRSALVRDAVPRLALLTKAPRTYIQCIQDVITAVILADIPQCTIRATKRK